MPRADLLALSDDSLAALANRGILKRALREVEGGTGPQLTERAGEVTGTWSDGTVVVLAAGATLDQATCPCPAIGVCRHRVMLALAARGAGARSGTSVPEPSRATSGDFSDAQLEGHLGPHAMAAARKVLRVGFGARVRRPTPVDPVATVELSSVTVRFLVAGDLGYAQVDAARGSRPDAVALAVWAWRAAELAAPGVAVCDVQVGSPDSTSPAEALETALEVVADILRQGASHLDEAVEPRLATARRALDARNLRWPVDVLDDLAEALRAYRGRAAHYSPAAAAGLVAELVARTRGADGGSTTRSSVLGTEEAGRTPMRLARLTGLGARLQGTGDRRLLEVFLAHPASASVLVVQRMFGADPDGSPPSLDKILRSQTGGHRLSLLAHGEVVTESAVRAANRTVTLSTSRVAKTTLTPSSGRWDALPPALLVRDLEALEQRLIAQPPALLRARVAAHDLRAVVVSEVLDVSWAPGAQELSALVRAPNGTLLLRSRHRVAAPGAVDMLHAALTGEHGEVRHVAGQVRRDSGRLVMEPTAVVAGDQVLVPDLAPATSDLLPVRPQVFGEDALREALDEALEATAAVLHHGSSRLPPTWATRAERAADRLQTGGLVTAATALRALGPALSRPAGRQVLDAWADVHLRLLLTAEYL